VGGEPNRVGGTAYIDLQTLPSIADQLTAATGVLPAAAMVERRGKAR